MHTMNRRVLLRSVTALAVASAVTFTASVRAQTPAAPIKIGALTFLTGKFSSYGQDVSKGMRLAVKQLNDAGAPNGARFDLDVEDTASDSAQAVSLLRRFAGTPDVVGVVGPPGTPDLLATLPLSNDIGLPVISLGSQKDLKHDQFGQWLVRVNLLETPDLMKEVLAQASRLRHFHTIALVRDRANDFCQAEATAVRQALHNNTDVKLLGDEAYAAGDKDFASVIDKLMRDKPEAIWIAGVTNEASLFIQQARARGFTGVFIGGAGLNDPKIAQLAKSAATGTITFLPFDEASREPAVKRFVTGYRVAYGGSVIPTYAAYGYDAVMLLANAISTAKSTDRTKVMQALGKTHGFAAATGSYTFNGKGDNVGSRPFLVEVMPQGTFKSLN